MQAQTLQCKRLPAPKIDDSEADASFTSYSLSQEVVKNTRTIDVSASPPRWVEWSTDLSLARFQNKNTANPFICFNSYGYYVDSSWNVVEVNMDTSTISTICTLPSPPPLRSGIYPEDVSMIMYDDQESQLLVIADGVGRLHIVQKPHTPDSQWIYRGFSDQLLDGRPYKLVGFHIQGSLMRIAVRAIMDPQTEIRPSSDAKAASDKPIEFVQPSSDSSAAAAASNNNNKEEKSDESMEYKRPSIRKETQYKLCVATAEFPPAPAQWTVVRAEILIGLRDIKVFSFNPASVGFALASEGRYVPPQDVTKLKSEEQASAAAQPEPQTTSEKQTDLKDGDGDDIDPQLLAQINERLKQYTKDKPVHEPFSHWKASFSIDDHMDMDVSAEEERMELSVFIYSPHPNPNRFTSSVYLSHCYPLDKYPMIFAEVLRNGTLRFGLGRDVDCFVMDFEWSAESNDPPLKWRQVAAIDAFSFIHEGKAQKRLTLVSPSCNYVAIVEHERFSYLYKRRPEGQHKSVHQLIEMDKEKFIGARWKGSASLALLTSKNLYIFDC